MNTQRAEFDRTFQLMEQPNYPAACDQCGAEGTNESMAEHECSLDLEIANVVSLLNEHGFKTFSSCSGRDGHGFSYPMVRVSDCKAADLFDVLLRLGYSGFYVKEYRSSHGGNVVDFVEAEFWSLDCLSRTSGAKPSTY